MGLKYKGEDVGNPILLDRFDYLYDNLPAGLEKYYFIALKLLRHFGFNDIYKTKDVLAAGEMSSFWGEMARRRSEQETKASQLLGTMSGMIKDMFKIMRELTTINQRLQYYEDSIKGISAGDLALKEVWITLVEGGGKQPTSVLGMGRDLGFVALPDYFYKTEIKSEDRSKVSEIIKERYAGTISKKLEYTLERKLKEFVEWRELTYKELTSRRKFIKSVLKNHINSLRLYANWIKPYLHNIKKLSNNYDESGSLEEGDRRTPEVTRMFETLKSHIHIKAVRGVNFKKIDKNKSFLVLKWMFDNITYFASPDHQKDYQRGYSHKGRVRILFLGYKYNLKQWLAEEEKENEDLMDFLANNVDSSISTLKDELIDVLGDDYYSVSGDKKKDESEKKDEKKEEKGGLKESVTNVFPFLSPFLNIFSKKNKSGESFLKIPFKNFINNKDKSFKKKKAEDDFNDEWNAGFRDREDFGNHIYLIAQAMKIETNLICVSPSKLPQLDL